MRSWLLERKVRFQTAALAARIEAEAALERRRGLILEDINGTRPLQEILKAITDLVSFKLGGAPCWCQIGNDQPVGNCPPEPAFLRIIQEPIPGRSETTLGFLHAGLGSLSDPDPEEEEALLAGAALAALAVETRRVYSDLRHRSEFDLLTDSQNRFSFERHLDALVEDARQTNTVFGLIFIDLDCFKDVNDRYGHHTGDLYLQEITRRMKHQLRSHDLLARLGGDEFGVLVPEANDRDDVDEIANRLKRCFDEPFVFDTILLRGSASIGIALYPIDGDSGDSLLSTADAAMYAAKNENRRGCAV
jgi:diguanylate cyclase (GGDEF)-like protein